MGWEPVRGAHEIEEVSLRERPSAAGRPGRPAGDRERGRAGINRWLPVVLVGGLALVIVGAGLLGPKVPAPDDRGPATPTAGPQAS